MATARARRRETNVGGRDDLHKPPCEGERKRATVPEAFVKAFRVFCAFFRGDLAIAPRQVVADIADVSRCARLRLRCP